MTKENKKESKVSPTEKLNLCNSAQLCNILSISTRAPLWNMAHKNVKDFSNKKEKYLFQFGCIYFMTSKQNMESKEQVERCLSSKFDTKMSKKKRKNTKDENTHAFTLLMFYDNRKSLIYKLLGVAVHFFSDEYVCIEYFFYRKKKIVSITQRIFKTLRMIIFQ